MTPLYLLHTNTEPCLVTKIKGLKKNGIAPGCSETRLLTDYCTATHGAQVSPKLLTRNTG